MTFQADFRVLYAFLGTPSLTRFRLFFYWTDWTVPWYKLETLVLQVLSLRELGIFSFWVPSTGR
jgi:hypothetical protein